jgi:hypothetical protein
MSIPTIDPVRHVEERERPSIVVHHDQSLTGPQLSEILLGIEEEGMPYRVQSDSSTDARKLAHDAAISSRLGVGVGVGGGRVAVTTEKLPADRPYLETQLGLRKANDRAAGGNAARLVKRMPLKVIE